MARLLPKFSAVINEAEGARMKSFSKAIVTATLLSFALLAAGCGNTWQGVKQDTSRNLDKAGDTVVKAGEKMKSD